MAKAKSRVNQAGNYTKPTMRKNLFQKLKPGPREVIQGNGRHEKPSCLRLSIKRLEEDTETRWHTVINCSIITRIQETSDRWIRIQQMSEPA